MWGSAPRWRQAPAGLKVSVSVCYTGFASFKLSHFRQIVTTRRPALAQVSEGAQALDKLEVAFDCRGGGFPLTGGVQRGTRQPRPRLPIPRAEAGALALHMRSVWVLTETVGSAALEAARSSTRGSGWAPSGPVSPPGSAEPPRAARRALGRRALGRRALRRRRSRAGALWPCCGAMCEMKRRKLPAVSGISTDLG